ncbi:MAG: uL22 family ribosomal protein [Nanoarchaeota archaeon]
MADERTKPETEEKKEETVKKPLPTLTKKLPRLEENPPVKVKPLPVDKEKAKEIEKEIKHENKDKQTEEKAEEKKESPKKEEPKKEIKKKEEAIARGAGLPVSKKHSMYICRFIKNKKIDDAIADLEKVTKLKKAIPYKGEIPHRKGDMTSGRYPVKAAGYFINLLKGLKGNVITNQMELEETRIVIASASWANRPMRRGGRSAKRTNVLLKAKEAPEKTTKGEKK